MIKIALQKMHFLDVRLRITSPLFSILKIHLVILYISGLLTLTLLYSAFMPYWTNPWLFIGPCSVTNCILLVYWNKKIDDYWPVLFSPCGKIKVYNAKIFFAITAFCIPFIAVLFLYVRVTNYYGKSDIMYDAATLSSNKNFVLSHYDELVDLSKVYDTIVNAEEKTDTSKSIFHKSIRTKYRGNDTEISYIEKNTFNTCFNDYVLQWFSTPNNLKQIKHATIEEQRVYERRIWSDTVRNCFRFLAVLNDTGVSSWVQGKISMKLLNSIEDQKDLLNYHLQLLYTRDTMDYENYLAQRKLMSKINGFRSYYILSYASFADNIVFKKYRKRREFEDIYRKICHGILGIDSIRSEKDIVVLNKRISYVRSNFGPNTLYSLVACIIIIHLIVLFCDIMLIKQTRGVGNSFQVFVWLCLVLVAELFLINGVYENGSNAGIFSLLSVGDFLSGLSATILIFFFLLLIFFLLAGNTRINNIQKNILPYVLIFLAIGPLVSIISIVVLYKDLNGGDKSGSLIHNIVDFSIDYPVQIFLSLFLVYILINYLSSRKFVNFYMAPQS